MKSGRFRHRIVALVAAYAVALQALLTAFVPMALAADAAAPLSIICTHNSGDGSGAPAQHDLPCAAVCAAMGHGIAGAVPPETFSAVPVPAAVAAAVPARAWVPPRIAVIQNRAPRGPPQA